MVKYIFQLFLLLLFNSSYSQVVLTGHIEEEGSGERLPYSNVYVSELEIGSSANENGYFTLVGEIKSGMTLRASYVGYKTQKFKYKLLDESEKKIVIGYFNVDFDSIFIFDKTIKTFKMTTIYSQYNKNDKKLSGKCEVIE